MATLQTTTLAVDFAAEVRKCDQALQELASQLAKQAHVLTQTVTDALYWYERLTQDIHQADQEAKAKIEAPYTQTCQNSLQAYRHSIHQIQTDLATIETELSLAEQDWQTSSWHNYQPNTQTTVPKLVRLGQLTLPKQYDSLTFPALLPIIGGRNVLIKASGAGKERARDALQALILRLLAALPAGKLRLTCIDPVGLGSTVAGFIKDLPDSITGGRAWFNQQDIETHLADLENHTAFVKQKYLGVSFSSIEEYNDKAQQIEEPYRLLVVADFPARFTDSAAQRLLSIATNGPSTGVYVLVMVDMDQMAQKTPYGFVLNDLERTATLIESQPQQNRWLDGDFENCHLALDTIPPAHEFEQIVKQIQVAVLAASDVRLSFSAAIPPETMWWTGDSRSGVQISIGQFGARKTQQFTFDEKLLSSALVVGKPGSGKSTLLHILIQGLAMTYSPNELELYLLDFKQVEFKDYALYNLPHAQVVAVKSEREFGLSVLRGLDGKLQQRKDLFKNITSLSSYRTQTGKPCPRIVLLADEFQELFSYDDALSTESALILDRLIRQGRAFGINILLASQTLAGANSLSNATKNQVPIRIALQCSEDDSRLILSDDNDAARLLERPGEAIFNPGNGRVQNNNRFQVFWLDSEERQSYLQRLRQVANGQPAFALYKPIVFDGDSPAELNNNLELMGFINGSQWTPPNQGYQTSVWLGEPIEIKKPTVALFKRQSRSNLMIIGQNEYEEDVLGMVLAALLSLAAQHAPHTARFELINLTDMDTVGHELPNVLLETLPHPGQVVKRRHLLASIEQVTAEVQTRLSQEEDERWAALYLIILGIHRARDLRREDTPFYRFDDSPEQKATPIGQLTTILREGPEVGVHTLLWCDTSANLSRILKEHDLANEFEMRVALPMGADESRSVVDSEAAAKLGKHRALFYNDGRSSRLEKFRPYGLPTAGWLGEQGQKLKGKQ